LFGIDDAILGAVLGAVSDVLVSKGVTRLQGDPQKRAFKSALAEAMSKFDEDHPALADSFFDSYFLTHRAAPVLARAIMRDPGPIAGDLARAYLEQLFGDAKRSPQDLEDFTRIAAQFLIHFDSALRRQQEAFGGVFDSRALDVGASYLSQLVAGAAASHVEGRQERVTSILETLLEASLRYHYAAGLVIRGQDCKPDELMAEISAETALFRLSRMEYIEAAKFTEAHKTLILGRYEAVKEAVRGEAAADVEFKLLAEGVKEFRRLLDLAPPI
jgi:hypothetical protein